MACYYAYNLIRVAVYKRKWNSIKISDILLTARHVPIPKVLPVKIPSNILKPYRWLDRFLKMCRYLCLFINYIALYNTFMELGLIHTIAPVTLCSRYGPIFSNAFHCKHSHWRSHSALDTVMLRSRTNQKIFRPERDWSKSGEWLPVWTLTTVQLLLTNDFFLLWPATL